MGDLGGRQLFALWAVLTAALILRMVGLGWGLPPADPETAATGYRSSYALHEDDGLFALTRGEPAALHLELTLLALEGAEAAGLLAAPWRDAFLEMRPDGFAQVYIVGRLTAALADMATVFLCFLLGARLGGAGTGLWAAAIVALAPGHVLLACQIQGEPLAALLLIATALAAVRGAPPGGVGLLAGLACGVKLWMAPPLAAICWPAAGAGNRAAVRWLAGGAALGLLIGAPYVLADPAGLWRQAGAASWSFQAPAASLEAFLRFGLGLPAGVLALAGIWRWTRGGSVEKSLAVAFVAGLAATALLPWPYLRSVAPILPLGAVAAACALSRLGRLRRAVGALALLTATLASLRLVESRLAPQPWNLAMAVVRQAAQPGDRVTRELPERPPLDPEKYPLGPAPTEWILTSDPSEPPGEGYERIAVFRMKPLWLWATLGESRTPLDWRALRPEVTLYRRE